MPASSPAALAPVPPSVAEWEDLLLRMEIMQRVLRNTLETVPPDDPDATAAVESLVERDAAVGEWLERVSAGSASRRTSGAARGDLAALADLFVSLRARNFAMLQRRGLEVWGWTADLAGHGDVSAYQVVTWLVAHDVRTLAVLRERSRNGTGAC